MLQEKGTPRAFTADEFNRMAEVGILAPNERVELIDGEVVRLSPQDPLHAAGVELCTELLVRTYSSTHRVRTQLPLSAAPTSEPEPDFALVPKQPHRNWPRHPEGADLILEIANTSLAYDRTVKASLYASIGVREYWILDMVGRRLLVLHDPQPDLGTRFGWSYAAQREIEEGGAVTSVVLGGPAVPVAQMLPLAGSG